MIFMKSMIHSFFIYIEWYVLFLCEGVEFFCDAAHFCFHFFCINGEEFYDPFAITAKEAVDMAMEFPA